MSEELTNTVSVNSFAGVFLVLTGTYLLTTGQNTLSAGVFLLTGIFFLTRAFAQHRTINE